MVIISQTAESWIGARRVINKDGELQEIGEFNWTMDGVNPASSYFMCILKKLNIL